MDDLDDRLVKAENQIRLEDGSYLDKGRSYKVLGPEDNEGLKLRMLPHPEPSVAIVRLEFPKDD